MRRIEEIIVHCSATRPDWMQGRSLQAKIDEIRRWHVEDNGWQDIGYHYVIDRDGTWLPGRQPDVIGAHCKGHNARSIGICLIGGFGGKETDRACDHYTKKQLDTLFKRINHLKIRYRTIVRVRGHNRYSAKACPCFYVGDWYDERQGKMLGLPTVTSERAGKWGINGLSATSVGGAAGATMHATSGLDPLAQVVLIGCATLLAIAGATLWYLHNRRS